MGGDVIAGRVAWILMSNGKISFAALESKGHL